MKENHDHQIDRTLRLLGSATPAPGMENRIVARLARADAKKSTIRRFRLPRLVFSVAAAAAASVIIVAGSISHSRRMLPVAPGLHLPATGQAGVGAASAAHVAQQPVSTLPDDRPRSVRQATTGRAVISPHAKKPAGVAVPKTLPAEQ